MAPTANLDQKDKQFVAKVSDVPLEVIWGVPGHSFAGPAPTVPWGHRTSVETTSVNFGALALCQGFGEACIPFIGLWSRVGAGLRTWAGSHRTSGSCIPLCRQAGGRAGGWACGTSPSSCWSSAYVLSCLVEHCSSLLQSTWCGVLSLPVEGESGPQFGPVQLQPSREGCPFCTHRVSRSALR